MSKFDIFKDEYRVAVRPKNYVGEGKENLTCPECGAKMWLCEAPNYLYKDGTKRVFYSCSRWPICWNTHGAHKNGKPLGVPADKETRTARKDLHQKCEEVWGEWEKANRGFMYGWLRNFAPKLHIAQMSKEECEQTISLLEGIISRNEQEQYVRNWHRPQSRIYRTRSPKKRGVRKQASDPNKTYRKESSRRIREIVKNQGLY